MNYYNPYFSFYPNSMNILAPNKTPGFLSGLFKGKIGWASILTNTQKILGIVNQGIPMIRQMSPIVKNAKTMFKVMNEFKKVETPQEVKTTNNSNQSNINEISNKIETIEKNINNGPQFFV